MANDGLVPANSDFPMMEIKEGDSFSVWGGNIHHPQTKHLILITTSK